MISKDKLTCCWAFWLSHSSGNKTQAQYKGNITQIHKLTNLNEFAYIWKSSPIAHLEEFFTDPATGRCNNFEIENEMKKVESINFFKNDIQPSWQFGDNSKGGYFNFSFSKDTPSEVVQRVYESLIFAGIGNYFQFCERVVGIRVVDTASKNMFRVRFEIWMNYSQSDLKQMESDNKELNQLFLEVQVKEFMGKMKFFDIGSKKKEPEEKK